MEDPIDFKSLTNLDVMYYYQAMNSPDCKQFKQTLMNKVKTHIIGNHWKMVPKGEVPANKVILASS